MTISAINFLKPVPKGSLPAAYRDARVLPLAVERRKLKPLNPAQTVVLYRAWRQEELILNAVPDKKVVLEAPIVSKGQAYFYHYPLDLQYLFSPQWRKDNLPSPFGFLRWAIEMDTALGLDLVKGYEGKRLGRDVLRGCFSGIREGEEDNCGYKKINLSLPAALVINTWLRHFEATEQLTSFFGNAQQAALAQAAGINNLGQLHSALSALERSPGLSWAQALGYNIINLPVKKVAALLNALKDDQWRKYCGNAKQAALAQAAGISHLGQLFSALSSLEKEPGLSWAQALGYNKINLPVKKVAALLKALKDDQWQEYSGNAKQAALAQAAGISHLGQLFSALSSLEKEPGLSWAQALGYNLINLPVKKAAAFFIELVAWVSANNLGYVSIAAELHKTKPQNCRRRFEEIKTAFAAIKEMIEKEKKAGVPEEFYAYLLKTLPFLPAQDQPVERARSLLSGITDADQLVQRIAEQLGVTPVEAVRLMRQGED